jgi:HK97 family phage major capsid protein
MPAEAPTHPTSTELRERCQEAAARLLDLRSTPADRRGDDFAVQLRDAATELHDFDALEQRTSRDEQRAFEQLVWDQAVADHEARAADPNQRGSRGPTAAGAETGEHRTAGQMFVESDAYTQRDSHNIGETEVRNLLTGSSIGTSGSDNLALIGQPYLHTPSLRRRRFFVRDLMSVETTGLQVIPYVQELNALTNETGAGTVMEASAKPEVTMQFTPAEAPVRKIAAWVQVTEEAFADAPTLRAYVDSRLAYMLLVEEEDQLINGNGTAPNISGILDQTGLQTQAAVDNDLAATIGLAAGTGRASSSATPARWTAATSTPTSPSGPPRRCGGRRSSAPGPSPRTRRSWGTGSRAPRSSTGWAPRSDRPTRTPRCSSRTRSSCWPRSARRWRCGAPTSSSTSPSTSPDPCRSTAWGRSLA